MKQIRLFLFAITVLSVAACTSTPKSDAGTETVTATTETKAQPVFLSNGTPVYNFDELSAFLNKDDGKTYVINFWATWCKPCVEELPYFEELTKAYDDSKVEVILVSLDFKKQFEKKLVPFMEDRAMTSTVMVLDDPDSNRWINEISKEWSGAIPATIIHNGSKSEFREGSYESFDELHEIVKTYL